SGRPRRSPPQVAVASAHGGHRRRKPNGNRSCWLDGTGRGARVQQPCSWRDERYAAAMGQLEQFAKETFALETTTITRGAMAWQLPPEVGTTEVHLDGLLRVFRHGPLAS